MDTLESLLRETLPHLEYKRTHTQTAEGRRNVAQLMRRINKILQTPQDDAAATEKAQGTAVGAEQQP